MWLVYPLIPEDVRQARRGLAVLLASSVLWYAAFAGVLVVWSGPLLNKVNAKFAPMPYEPTNWPSIFVLLAAVVATGLLRLLGYRMVRNVAGAVGAGEGLFIAGIGAVIWIGMIGMLYFGFSGLLAVAGVFAAAAELRFVRFPAQIFGLVVSAKAVTRVSWYFWGRTAWLAVVLFAGLVMLASHVSGEPLENTRETHGLDRPLEGHSPEFQFWTGVRNVMRIIFNALALTAIVTTPLVVAGYWTILIKTRNTVPKLLDPNAPLPPTPPPDREGYNYLKTILQNPGL